MKHYIKLILATLFFLSTQTTFAQDSLNIDTLNKRVQQMEKVFNSFSKIKISGYIQAQFQVADSAGVSSFEGGSFPSETNKRFMVRRGRLKVQHTGKYSISVVQIDATEKGVGIKDAYITLTEPWTKTLSLTMGIFNRPFGFEIPYSSSQRESPERARMSQIIFPGERDLGAMISLHPPKGSPVHFIKIDAGLFNGNGVATDFDTQKDFIGRLRFNEIIKSDIVMISVGGSYYNGGWRQSSSNIYEMGLLATGAEGFINHFDTAHYGKVTERQYVGGDAQFSFKWPAGTTTLRGEYITGQQPASSGSTNSPATSVSPQGAVYYRDFEGAYFYFIHDILKSGHQVVLKYDWYDPNTTVESGQIGAIGSNLGVAEIRYESLGFGWNYNISNDLKLMAFYQTVKNETTNLSGFTKDLTDSVLTLRLQHKF